MKRNVLSIITMLFFISFLVSCNMSTNVEGELNTLENNEESTILDLNDNDMEKKDEVALTDNNEPVIKVESTSNEEKNTTLKKDRSDNETTVKEENEEIEVKESEPTVSKASGSFYVTAQWLNVRSGAGTNY